MDSVAGSKVLYTSISNCYGFQIIGGGGANFMESFEGEGLIKLPFSGICYVDQVNLELSDIHLPLTLRCYE